MYPGPSITKPYKFKYVMTQDAWQDPSGMARSEAINSWRGKKHGKPHGKTHGKTQLAWQYAWQSIAGVARSMARRMARRMARHSWHGKKRGNR